MFNDNEIKVVETKIIPDNFRRNDVSPTEEKIVRIDNQGNVDFFIKCGNWAYKANNEYKKNIYYKFSFKVREEFFENNFESVDDFVERIKDSELNNLTAMIVAPKNKLTDSYETDLEEIAMPEDVIIKIEDILDGMKGIGNGGWSIAMVKFLYKFGLKKEVVELCKREFKEMIEIVEHIKEKELKDLENKNNNLKQQLENKNKELKDLENKNNNLKQQLENKNKELKDLENKNNNLKQQLENKGLLFDENKHVEKGNAEIGDLREDEKQRLYKPKDEGFLSIFSCCTCGLDNVGETEVFNELGN